jgi:hypothetical protein
MFDQGRSAGLAAEKRLLFMVIRKTCLEFRRCCERIKKGEIWDNRWRMHVSFVQ